MKDYDEKAIKPVSEEELESIDGGNFFDDMKKGVDVIGKFLTWKNNPVKCPKCHSKDCVEGRPMWRKMLGANYFYCSRCDYSFK